jgi:hypothetical protein
MAKLSQFITHGYLLSDAMHVEKAVKKHWVLVKARGATDAELKQFGASILDAKQYVSSQKTGLPLLELARQDLKDRLGEFRSSARSVVSTINGVDAAAEKDLQMKGGFPQNDLALSNYVDAIAPHLPAYAAKLTARDFGPAKQRALLDSGANFQAAFTARGLERGEARAATLGREGAFKKLQTEITYFRTLGHEALRSSVARKDFDRVGVPAKPLTAAAVAAKKTAAAAKKAAAAAKKSQAQAKKPGNQPLPATGT